MELRIKLFSENKKNSITNYNLCYWKMIFVFTMFFLLSNTGFSQIDTIKSTEFFKYGLANSQREHYDSAVSYYDSAIQFNPLNWRAYRNRGLAETDLGRYEKAIKDFDTALGINQKDYFAYKGRAEAYRFYGYYDSAFNDYNKVIGIHPEDVSPYYGRGWILSNKIHKLKEALHDFDAYIDKVQTWAPAYAERSATYFKLEMYNEAIKDADSYFKLQGRNIPPKYYYLYDLRGKAYAIKKINDSAINDLTKYVQLEPQGV